TNDLDITTMGALEQLLLDFAGSVLVVSHDRYFLDRVATSILAFEGEGRVGHYEGDYTSYSRLRAERERLAAAAASAAPAAPVDLPAAKARPTKLSYKETRELAEIENTILAAEAEVTRLEGELNDPGLYRRDAAKAAQLGTELGAARERVSQLMDRWQELESKREAFEASKA
ncbi:MAG TPA: ABC transporter ATP-binding protein, partial [Polyangiaceae bacterium]|nr:ABC transporter ATP-binding protein [Polyangiaceae bacterium]